MPTTFSPASLGASLTDAATNALPYIGVGVTAGVVVLAAMWGLGLGIKALRKVGK